MCRESAGESTRPVLAAVQLVPWLDVCHTWLVVPNPDKATNADAELPGVTAKAEMGNFRIGAAVPGPATLFHDEAVVLGLVLTRISPL